MVQRENEFQVKIKSKGAAYGKDQGSRKGQDAWKGWKADKGEGKDKDKRKDKRGDANTSLD